MEKESSCTRKKLIWLLETTSKGNPITDKLWKGTGNYNFKAFVEKNWDNCSSFSYRDTKEAIYDAIATLMSDFVAQFPAPPIYRQKIWDACSSWLGQIANELEFAHNKPFSEYVARPYERDLGIELIKALHSKAGASKEELALSLGVSTKTIQTDLRAIDPTLNEGSGHVANPLRIGGQEIHAKIQCVPDPKTGKRYYRIPERVHPIVLQLNTFELGTLFRALSTLNCNDNGSLSLELAMNIWSQLSECARQRVSEVFGEADNKLQEFLEDCESSADFDELPVFKSEPDQFNIYTQSEQIMEAFKGSRVCDIDLRIDGDYVTLKNQRIWRDDNSWYAIPNEAFPSRENAIAFDLSDVRGYVDLKM